MFRKKAAGSPLAIHGSPFTIPWVGSYELKLFRVWTDEVTAMLSGDDVSGLLRDLPDAPALTLASAGTS